MSRFYINNHAVRLDDAIDNKILSEMFYDCCSELAICQLGEKPDKEDIQYFFESETAKQSSSFLFIKTTDGRYAGFIQINDWGRNMDYIAQFYIRPQFRRMHAGKQVAKEILRKKPYCVLTVLDGNTPAHFFWRSVMEKNGYVLEHAARDVQNCKNSTTYVYKYTTRQYMEVLLNG